MTTNISTPEKGIKVPRPPVVVVVGHIDHGKSTLLDYVRKTNMVAKEAGGITQHLGAYEVEHKTKDGKTGMITFLDTPGHEAFKGIRGRGAAVADIGILVISAEEGVKPQTLEALRDLKKSGIPYIVVATKIDKPEANVERVKQSLAEHEVYLEGYGGDVPFAAVSGKTGDGVAEFLDLISLVAELHAVGNTEGAVMRAYVIESRVDNRKGVSATIIIKDGVLKKGDFLVAGEAVGPTRRIEDFLGKEIEKGEPGMPVRVVGWSSVPRVGAACVAAKNKREAEDLAASGAREKGNKRYLKEGGAQTTETVILPLVLKADASGSLEAVEAEAKRQATEKVTIKIIARGIGSISEGDIRIAMSGKDSVVAGFNVGVDAAAKSIIERGGAVVRTFDVIYALGEWMAELVKARTPKVMTTVVKADVKVLKIFNTEKDRQVIGGKVLQGELGVGDELKILRRGAEIGHGKIRELQKFKEKVSSTKEGSEFGAFVSTSIEIMPSDTIEAVASVEQ